MANFSLQNFKSEVNSRGFAKPNRFEVSIMLPQALADSSLAVKDSRLVSLFCESANLPTQSIGVKQQRIYGPMYQRPYNVDYGGEGISLTFLVDRQMNVKAFFDSWISKIVDPVQYFVYYQSTYATTMRIDQLDEQDNITYSVLLEDTFPRNTTVMELNNTTQNQVHKLGVTFAYRRWKPFHPITNEIKYPATIAGINNPLL